MADKKVPTIAEIEEFINEAGSDHLGVFGGTFEGGIHCQQISDEIAPAIHHILSNMQISTYLEIGVAAGGTTYLFNHFCKLKKIVLVDNNKHWKAIHRDTVLTGIERTEVIGDSHDLEVIAQVSGPFDLIIIDGDHTYAGVRGDINAYLPMLAQGGVLFLHDTALPEWGVMVVVNELKKDDQLEFIGEFVSTTHSTPCGVTLFKKL